MVSQQIGQSFCLLGLEASRSETLHYVIVFNPASVTPIEVIRVNKVLAGNHDFLYQGILDFLSKALEGRRIFMNIEMGLIVKAIDRPGNQDNVSVFGTDGNLWAGATFGTTIVACLFFFHCFPRFW